MPKLPFPPPPKLNPAPKRPGEGNGKTSPLDTAAEAGISAVDWIDERTQLSGAARWLMYRKVPKGTNWFYTLGTATMFAFLNQAVTGVFLAMYYDPSPTRAYESTRYITNEAFLGEFVRGMHKWGSSVMVILIFLHMARTFFFGAYKYPRELNWVIGVVLRHPHLRHGADRATCCPSTSARCGRRWWRTTSPPAARSSGPTSATSCAPGPSSGRPRCRASTPSTCCWCPGAIAALIGAHLYLVAKLGHHGAAVAARRGRREAPRGARVTARH